MRPDNRGLVSMIVWYEKDIFLMYKYHVNLNILHAETDLSFNNILIMLHTIKSKAVN